MSTENCIARLCLLGIFLVCGQAARAFEIEPEPNHQEITREGLSAPSTESFLRTFIRRSINRRHAWMDDRFSLGTLTSRATHDEKHFDDCEFDGAAAFIRESYRSAGYALAGGQMWTVSAQFGNVLHTVQDFYSHSNWVELGFPRAENAQQSDLVDLSGAQGPPSKRWYAPEGGDVVRGDILLGADDWQLPAGYSIRRNGGGLFIPTLIDPFGEPLGRLLETAQGAADDECDVATPAGPDYTGISHDSLNKDCSTCGSGPNRAAKFRSARKLAVLQTSYEWCRLVREAALVGWEDLILALWVREGGNPHPVGTPCAPVALGATKVVVTIESVQILDSGDGDEAGEIQLAAALYDDPLDFHRSTHATSRGGYIRVNAGSLVPSTQLPPQLSLCLSPGQTGVIAIHGWDNDDPPNDQYAFEFDNDGNEDELLVGLRGSTSTGQHFRRTEDLAISYRVSRSFCQPEVILDPRG